MSLIGDHGDEARGPQQTLLHLHNSAGTFDVDPGLIGGGRPEIRRALTELAEASLEEVPASARLDVLAALARAEYPGDADDAYQMVAATITGDRLDPDMLLRDLANVAGGRVALADTATGAALPHELTAFLFQDVCSIADVRVNGLEATWIFSEFETDAPFRNVADWVNPVNWPARGPLVFKKMEVTTGAPTMLAAPAGARHWHGVYLEEVQLVERLQTLLHCDYYEQDGAFAGMTYLLVFSADGKLNVDRGFLLVVDVAGTRRVKALKVVGFTNPLWRPLSKTVCPLWTDFVRAAAQGGTTSTPRPPSQPGNVPRSGDNYLDDWIRWMADAAKAYTGMAADWMVAATAGGYGSSDFVRDAERLWGRLADDWTHVWNSSTDIVRRVASPSGTGSGSAPSNAPAASPAAAASPPAAGSGQAAASGGSTPLESGPAHERAIVPVGKLGANATVACPNGLTKIGAHSVHIPDSAITLRRVALSAEADGIEVDAATSTAPAGLYIGDLVVHDAAGDVRVPAQLYVSKARATTP